MKRHTILIITPDPHLKAQLKAAVGRHDTVVFDNFREAGVSFRKSRITKVICQEIIDGENAFDWAMEKVKEHDIPFIMISQDPQDSSAQQNAKIKIIQQGVGYLQTIHSLIN